MTTTCTSSLIHFHDAIAWFMQISIFVLSGLLVHHSRIPSVALPALAIAVVLMLVARPIAVVLTLLPFRMPVREVGVSWVGLRGAAPIILATFPVAAGVPGGEQLFVVVFFVVFTSVLVQGTSIPFAAKALGITAPPDARSTATGSFDTVITGDEGPQLHEILVEPSAHAVGCQQGHDLALPQGVLIVLVRARLEELHAPRQHRHHRSRPAAGSRRTRAPGPAGGGVRCADIGVGRQATTPIAGHA